MSFTSFQTSQLRNYMASTQTRTSFLVPVNVKGLSTIQPGNGRLCINRKRVTTRALFSGRQAKDIPVAAVATADPPTVADTKAKFLKAYKIPIPAMYNGVIQELLVQEHLVRYNERYQYDPVYALGLVTVFEQLMDGYPYGEDNKEGIYRAFVGAFDEDPAKFRADAKMVEDWAAGLDAQTIAAFAERDGPVDKAMKDIKARASGEGQGSFLYSKLFAIGLFRILEATRSSDPAVLGKLCAELGVNKGSVDRDLDMYRGLLSKLAQGKEMLREYLERENKKKEEKAKESAAPAQGQEAKAEA